MPPLVSILIPVYNCRPWVARAVESALEQTWPNVEVIALDDASTDGSWEVLQEWRSKIRVERSPRNGGQNVSRNLLTTLSPPIRVLALNRRAAISRDFPNCAGVMLRTLYGKVAEYPPFFSHAYAEPDYCLQLYTAGYALWFEPSLVIRHHFTSKERNMLRRHWLNARNELWSMLMRCPIPYVLAVAPLRVARQFLFALGKGSTWWSREPKWWWDAIRGISRCIANRKPVSWRSFLSWTQLARRPAGTLDELRARFGEGFARLP